MANTTGVIRATWGDGVKQQELDFHEADAGNHFDGSQQFEPGCDGEVWFQINKPGDTNLSCTLTSNSNPSKNIPLWVMQGGDNIASKLIGPYPCSASDVWSLNSDSGTNGVKNVQPIVRR